MTLAETRVPRGGLAAIGLSLLAAALLVYFGRRLSFFGDEWTFVVELPGASGRYFLEPHNEHWSTLPKLIYWLLLRVFGLRTYLPYMAVLGALHAGTAVCLYWLIRRRSGELLALAALPLFLFMGRASEDLLWANQMGFVGSVMAGLAALLLLDSAAAGGLRLALASALLLAGLMFSGVGLAFVAAAAVELATDPRRRAHLVTLALPLLAYVAWYGLFGRAGVAVHRNPFSIDAVVSLVDYVPRGVGASVAGLASLSEHWAFWALGGLMALVAATAARRGRFDSRVLGAGAGLLTFFVLSGLVRSQLAPSRYVYVAAPFILLLGSDALRDVRLGGRWLGAGAVALLAVTAHSSAILVQQYQLWALRAAAQNAELQVLGVVQEAPDLDRGALVDPDLAVDITIGDYFWAVRTYGLTAPAIQPAGIASLPPEAVDRVLRRAFASRISIEGAPPLAGCRPVDRARGHADVQVAPGGSIGYAQASDQPIAVYLSYADGPPQTPTVQLRPKGGNSRIRLPETGLSGRWSVRIEPSPNVPAATCD